MASGRHNVAYYRLLLEDRPRNDQVLFPGGPNATQVAKLLLARLRESRGPVAGEDLAAFIYGQFPGFRFEHVGVQRLRDFVRVHLSDSVFTELQNGAVLYSVGNASKRREVSATPPKVTRAANLASLSGLTTQIQDTNQLLSRIRDEVARCREAGDWLGAGEWCVSLFPYLTGNELEEAYARAVACWASPTLRARSTQHDRGACP